MSQLASDLAFMSTPREQSARDLLLEAASQLMCERETLAVSLSDIAGRAGLNSALVKYYFGGKTGLQYALIERDLSDSLRQLRGLLTMDLSPAKKLRLSIGGIMRVYFRYPYINQLMMATMRDGTEEMRRAIADNFLQPLYETYAQLIREGVEAGEFQAVDPKVFYFNVVGACDQIYSARYVYKYVHGEDGFTEESQRVYTQQVTRQLMDGLAG
jgi:TetR/AcrR family transcriptional regulator